MKTYTPSGKRKFKAKVLGSSSGNLLDKLAPVQESDRTFKASAGADFKPTTESFEKPVEEETQNEEPKKASRFKKLPSKKPGEDFSATDQDFRVDEK